MLCFTNIFRFKKHNIMADYTVKNHNDGDDDDIQMTVKLTQQSK